MERLTKMDWLSKIEWPSKLEWRSKLDSLKKIDWRIPAMMAGVILGVALITAGANKMVNTYSNWQNVYAFKCRDLRDNQRFRYRSDDAGQLSGKYQIRRGVYIKHSEHIKCEQRLIKGS